MQTLASSAFPLCLFLASLLALAAAIPSETGGSYPSSRGFEYFFSFGDSYTTTGFNLTNGSPLPAPKNPLGNPVYPGFTSANGPNWIDYLTTTFNTSEVLTYNLAYGGATIDSALVKPYREDVLSLKQQVQDLFLKSLPPGLPWKGQNSLFLIWIGINDVGNSWRLGNWDKFHKTLLDAYFSLVDELLAAGARNFLFVDVPPIERSPMVLADGADSVEQVRLALASFNSQLFQRVTALGRRRKDVWAKLFSSSAVFTEVLNHATEYGFANSTAYCTAYQTGTPKWNTLLPECGVAVDKYFWLNTLHPTHLVHKIVAHEAAKVL